MPLRRLRKPLEGRKERDRRSLDYREAFEAMAVSPPGCPDILALMDAAWEAILPSEITAHSTTCPLCCRRLAMYREIIATPED
jgi:hypothetical protein